MNPGDGLPGLPGVSLRAIAAMAENRVIGRDGDLPWHLPEDLKTFKRLTSGAPVIMGRNTWLSLPFKPLPRRHNIVVSRSLDAGELPAGVDLVPSIAALDTLSLDGTAWLIGGASLYGQLLPACDELYLSLVYGEPEGDAAFPPFEHLFDLAETVATYPEFELRRYTRNAG